MNGPPILLTLSKVASVVNRIGLQKALCKFAVLSQKFRFNLLVRDCVLVLGFCIFFFLCRVFGKKRKHVMFQKYKAKFEMCCGLRFSTKFTLKYFLG